MTRRTRRLGCATWCCRPTPTSRRRPRWPAERRTPAGVYRAGDARKRNAGCSAERRQQPRVLFRPLRRQRPLRASALLVLAAEERVLHAAVDDAPRQHGIVRAIAVDVEV